MLCRRVLTLLLLFCGLSTSPLFSLEQSAEDGVTTTSVPQCGTRLSGKAVEVVEAGGGGWEMEGLDGYGPPVHHREHQWATPSRLFDPPPRPSEHPPCTSGLLTYFANAPPTDTDSNL